MTREQRVNKLALTGAPKFARARPSVRADVGLVAEGKPLPPQTPDSGFSECQNKTQPEAKGNEDGGDFGVASVIHVIEPDASGARHWWHTKGFKSDPYVDGTLPLPSVRESKAAGEAREAAKKVAEARERIKKEKNNLDTTTETTTTTILSNPDDTPPLPRDNPKPNDPDHKRGETENRKEFLSPGRSDSPSNGLQAVPLRLIGAEDVLKDSNVPRNALRGEAFTGKLLKTGVNSSLARVNLNRLNSSNNTRPDRNGVNKQLLGRGGSQDQSNLKGSKTGGKPSVVAERDRSAERKSPSSATEGENTGRNKPGRIIFKRSQGSKPVILAARRGPILKSTSTGNLDDGNTTQARESGRGSSSAGGFKVSNSVTTPRRGTWKPTRPSSTSVYESKSHGGQGCTHHHDHRRPVEKREKTQVYLRSQTPPRRSSSPAVINVTRRSRSKSPASGRARSVTPDTPRKQLFRPRKITKGHSFPNLPSRERGKSALKKKSLSDDQQPRERAKSPRKVCFVTDNDEGTVSTMDGKSAGAVKKNSQPTVNSPVKKMKKTKIARKKPPGKPTQRALDNEAILDVAQANKYSIGVKKNIEEERKKAAKDCSQVSSDSEAENDEESKVTKNAWEIFEEQVKSIDDGNIAFNSRDLSSKSSDLFEKVMWEVGPQFRRPTRSEGQESEDEMEDKVMEKAVPLLLRRNSSLATKVKSKRGWSLLRKTMMEIHMESGKSDEASLNWKFLCTTISNMTDMQKGREALYQKYIYDPNSWMKGFSTPPAAVLKHGHRNKFKDPVNLRNIQSANGHSTVVIGHQSQDDLTIQGTGSKTRVTSTQGKIKVAPYKSAQSSK